ncbi:hypothetical protein [Alkaliphilus crotonatoxidans]
MVFVFAFLEKLIFFSRNFKSSFISLLVSGMVLLFPVIGGIQGIIGELLYFMPSQVLIAANHFMFFKAYYILGNAVLMQYVVLTVAVAASISMVLIACRTFQQWQVEN